MKKKIALFSFLALALASCGYTGSSSLPASSSSEEHDFGSWETVTYGSYPQTHVNDSSLIARLDALDPSSKNEAGYFKLDDEYYFKAEANPYGLMDYFDDGGLIFFGFSYWFKVEPITWNILKNDSGKLYVVSNLVLDEHRFLNMSGGYSYPYSYGDLLNQLNGSFYQKAFFEHDACILKVDDNPKVFLLSEDDLRNKNYGFEASKIAEATSRIGVSTDYARTVGVRHPNNNNNAQYFTSSSSYVNELGSIITIYTKEDKSMICGLRPAMWLEF